MKLGLSIGYSGSELRLPVEKVLLAERLGFDSVLPRLLADSPADLGLARRLNRAACPVSLAFRILA